MNYSKLTKDKILVIEDDKTLASLIKKKLSEDKYMIELVHDGKHALSLINRNMYSLLLVDIGLPSMSGYEIIQELRNKGSKIPVMIITSYDSSEHELKSFKTGANLFHRKPINFDLLEQQVNSLIVMSPNRSLIEIGDLKIEPLKRYVERNGKEINLSYKEFELLMAVVKYQGEVLSRKDLLDHTFKGVRESEEGSIDTLVSRVRKKLSQRGKPEVIETVRGIGFRLNLGYVDASNS